MTLHAMATARPSAPIAVFIPTASPVLVTKGLLVEVAVELVEVVEVELLSVTVRSPSQAWFQLLMAVSASDKEDGSAATMQSRHD